MLKHGTNDTDPNEESIIQSQWWQINLPHIPTPLLSRFHVIVASAQLENLHS